MVDQLGTLRREKAPVKKLTEAFKDLQKFIGEMVLAKQENPGDDVLSGLVDSDFTDEEMINISLMLLSAGLDTTASSLAVGTFVLLCNPDQLAALRETPEMTEQAVEELLRYTTILPITIRAAREDVELDGHLIKAGDVVTVASAVANRDPKKFVDPDALDLSRSERGHLAFGHGVHQCLAQQLARVELQIAFPALLRRFPTLRLVDAPEEVPVRDEIAFFGLHELQVAWD
ncbi:hypothetical protein GCM10010341_92000 [Streptomyces noursei]|nr:hypothetical protein GCM10010341_92000 [Streptomyces noursei]